MHLFPIRRSFIYFFFYPFCRKKLIHFKTSLKKAKHFLVLLPRDIEIIDAEKTIAPIIRLFPQSKLVLFQSENQKKNNQAPVNQTFSTANQKNIKIIHFIDYKSLDQLNQYQFDVLLDLDPNSHFLNLYLCSLLKTTIRIAFQKSYGFFYYNLLYKGKPDILYQKQLKGLYHSLQRLLQ